MPSIFESVIRADDFLHCEFEFVNLVLRTSSTGAQQLERAAAGPAFIVLRLPPQHIAEQVVPEGSFPNLPFSGGLSGPSRLTCRLPDTFTRIEYRLDALLALLGNADLLSEADGQATVIEFPDRLLLVPRPSTRPVHRPKPFTSPKTGVTELWHTTLRNPSLDTSVQFRAIPNPRDTDAAARSFKSTLTKANRADIVTHSRLNPDPHVVASSLLRLTSLGATTCLKGTWRVDPNISLAAWEHQAELGRDYYAYTLEQGFLFPFGHRATIATITERKFASEAGTSVAELGQTKILAVLDEERSYELENIYPGHGREMPFVRVRIASAPQRISDNDAPILVGIVLEDLNNNRINCSANVLFVPVAATTAQHSGLRERYTSPSVTSPTGQLVAMSFVALDGQRVTLADDDRGRRDTSLNVESVTFGVKLQPELQGPTTPPFLPFMAKAEAKIPGLEHMVGTSAGATPAAQRRATAIEFHAKYLSEGFDRKEVYLKFNKIPGISIPADRAGGLAAPTFPEIDGLSAKTGPVANVQDFINGQPLSAKDLIGTTQLLGFIPLAEIIQDVAGNADPVPGDVLQLFQKVDGEGNFVPRPVMTTVRGPSGIETRFVWKPEIKQQLPTPLKPIDNKMELVLKGRITKGINRDAPAFEVRGTLKNFELSFDLKGVNVLAVQFSSLEFISEASRKVDVKLNIKRLDFRGALQFVHKLQEALPVGGFAKGPSIQSLPDGLVVRYAIPLPAIPLGVMSIQNIAVSTSVALSFVNNKPVSVRFALSERNNPFQITVSIFGGTGFFALEVFTDGRVGIEAALEFGGIAALNLVVVKGGVYLLVGIYISIKDGDVLIEGHLRLGGFVDVLGLISVSIEVFVALTYDSRRNVLFGTGRLTVGVKLLFFSESFSFEIKKEIPGFGDAPTESIEAATTGRGPNVTADQWKAYCGAFT